MIQTIDFLLRNGKAFMFVGLLAVCLAACGGNDNGDPAGGVDDPGQGSPVGDDNNDDSGGGDDTDDGSNNGNDDSGDDDDGSGDGTDNGTGDDNPGDDEPAFETFQSASTVIGQADFAGGEENQGGGGPDANSLYLPLGGVGYSAENDVLFIADSSNARVLGFRGIPGMNNANADFVLGQSDFTSSQAELGASGMISPEAVTTTGGQLIVTDTDLNRVTVYEDVPTSGGAVPVFAVGQASLEENAGAVCDAATLLHPHAHFLSPPDAEGNRKLLVADAAHNRVLVWTEMPAESGVPADFVLGQNGFDNCSFREPENFRHPAALWTDGERLIVADSEKHRVLIWNTFPTESFQVPDVILGQADMQHVAPNDDNQDGVPDGNVSIPENCHLQDCHVSGADNGDATARTLFYPRDLDVVDGKLYVADMNNHRVLIWNAIPAESFAPADIVLGQQDFTSNAPNAGQAQPNARGFDQPVGVRVVEDRLFVTGWKNSRVMVFNAQ
ncbi:MAG TPA: hypothetical protein VF254_05400 [Gammaproteobacteria bacterium]